MLRLWFPLVLVAGAVVGLTLFSNQTPPPIQGMVADVQGNPLADVKVELSREYGEDLLLGHLIPDSNFHSQTVTAEDGSFLLPDPKKKGHYRLNASQTGFTASSVEVKRGEQGVAVTMLPGWSISGQVVWDESISEKGMYVAIHSKDNGWGYFEYGAFVYPSTEGKFKIAGVAAGSYLLTVLPDRNGNVLFQSPLELADGGGTMKADVIDLKGKLKAVVIKLIAEEGDFFPAWATDTKEVQVGWCTDDTILLVINETPIDLIIHARGYRNVELKGVFENQEVHLTKGIPVEFSFGRVPGIPKEWVEEIDLVLQPGVDQGDETMGRWGNPRISLTAFGKLYLPTPGTYKVMMGLRKYSDEDGYSSSVTFFSTEEEAPSIVVLDQTEVQNFHIPVNQFAAQSAVFRLRFSE